MFSVFKKEHGARDRVRNLVKRRGYGTGYRGGRRWKNQLSKTRSRKKEKDERCATGRQGGEEKKNGSAGCRGGSDGGNQCFDENEREQ